MAITPRSLSRLPLVDRLVISTCAALLAACGGAATPSANAPGASGDETASSAAEEGSPGSATAQGSDQASSNSESAPADAPADNFPKVEPKDTGRPQLDASDVKETVATYRPHLGETCWDPRVKKQPDGPDPVRVAIEVEVLPDGKVQSVRAVGGKEYEGMAECVQHHVERWQFPLAKQRSTLMFPIMFSRSEATVIQVR